MRQQLRGGSVDVAARGRHHRATDAEGHEGEEAEVGAVEGEEPEQITEEDGDRASDAQELVDLERKLREGG